MLHLTEEEKQELKEFVLGDQYRPVVKLMELFVDKEEKNLLSIPMNGPEDERKLAYQKMQGVGARKVFTQMRLELEKLRLGALDPDREKVSLQTQSTNPRNGGDQYARSRRKRHR